ncbi:Coadhesin,Thrombospondin-1,Mucin-like protein [Mytilus coruscus]|uniref:Coadhesin,Thrombospondin-1,Mucin-like protein n=1 Tax=Mytilus coruscus TaxID=42192 RepID=A0A6J8AGY7_MYTCO|nr:Coadhesin,Thrombospondin-1,Mucin-like protein [Mytilus coruscus]
MKNLSGLSLLVLAFTVSQVYGYITRKYPCRRSVDGGWSDFEDVRWFGGCSVTCGAGMENGLSTRKCNNPTPQHGGKQCVGSSNRTESRPCRLQECPSDGGWSEYGNFNEWSACSVTCGKGTKSHQRARSCTKPEPQFGGKDCKGSEVDIQTESCDMLDCPDTLADGGWSEYGSFNEWSACSVTCGNGTKSHQRTRSCTKPEPQFGGKDCKGSEVDIQTESCDMLDCPADGGWSEYGNFNEWSACSVTCGNGTKSHQRTRSCTKPEPQFGGKDCKGSEVDIQTESCDMLDCPADGGWSEYGSFNEWSACSVTCGNGTKSHQRTRSCTKPEPQFGGKDCEGSEVDIQTESCDMLDCPADGGWSEYGSFNEWSACSVTCGNGTKSHQRTRSCTKPEPQFAGKDCEGSEVDIQTESCDMLDCPGILICVI